MTDAVCTICGQWTPEYRQIIREFLRRNYQALYDVFLWPESLVVVRVPYTTEQVIMPAVHRQGAWDTRDERYADVPCGRGVDTGHYAVGV